MFCGKDEEKFANMLGIGLIGVTEQDIEYLIVPQKITPLYLQKSVSYPNLIYPGEEFQITYSIVPKNKIISNLQIEYVPSGPLRCPEGNKNRTSILEIPLDEREEVILKIKVRENTKPGSYPLMIKTACEGMETDYDLFHIPVSERKVGV